MSSECIFQEIRQVLTGRPGQPIVLGVCRTLAARIGKEVWLVRLVTIVLGVFWALPIIAAYILSGFLLAETAERTRRFFAGLGIIARETAEKMLASLGSMFGGGAGETSRFRSL